MFIISLLPFSTVSLVNAFDNDGNETDTTASLGRRVKITFSNGNPAVYSTAASGFTVSNIASYASDSNASFFGSGSGGSEDDNNTATPEFDYNGSGGGSLDQVGGGHDQTL